MAAIKFKSALGIETMYENGFGGIDLMGKKGTCLLAENFDPCTDGSMKTRSGYASVAEYQGNLRASFNFAGKLYAVIGNSLVVTDIESGNSEIMATLNHGEGEADIFCFGGDIYIHDGREFYRLSDGVLTNVEGYAPLYGSGWNPQTRGAINEELNLLSDRIRVSYSITSTTNDFKLGLKAISIDRVEINGTVRDLDEINARVDENDSSILHTSSLSGNTYITFWLTLSSEYSETKRIKQPTKAFVFGNNGGERLCLYHPGISCNLYSSQILSKNDQTKSAAGAANAIPIYIPVSPALCIGSGASPITGIAHHYGRGILFTETDAWFIDWEGSETDEAVQKPQCFLLNSAIGADHIHSSAYFDNDPITYFCGKLWRWHSQSGVRDECSASMISDMVSELIPKDSEKISMLSLPQKQKIFISDADDIEGKLLIYDLARKAWTIYRGIFAERVFRYGNLPAFSRGGCIYVFFDNLCEDVDTDEKFPISSRMQTHFLNFGCPEQVKRSGAVLIECALSGGEATLTLENEKGEKIQTKLRGKISGGREQFSVRVHMPRFKKLRLTLETSAPAVIYNAIISAK